MGGGSSVRFTNLSRMMSVTIHNGLQSLAEFGTFCLQFTEVQVSQPFQDLFTLRCQFNQNFTPVFLTLAADGDAALH